MADTAVPPIVFVCLYAMSLPRFDAVLFWLCRHCSRTNPRWRNKLYNLFSALLWYWEPVGIQLRANIEFVQVPAPNVPVFLALARDALLSRLAFERRLYPDFSLAYHLVDSFAHF